jgi:hypothetical protein
MSFLPKPVGPRAAFRDLIAFLRHRSREQVIAALLAILVTSIIVIEFLIEPYTIPQSPAPVIYVQSWSAKRTTAEIVADQKKDQEAKRAAQLERQREFQKLAKDFGIK